MGNPHMIKQIKQAVTIPVMAKVGLVILLKLKSLKQLEILH